MKTPKTPSGLGLQGSAFWKKVLNERIIDDESTLQRLKQACETLDNIYNDGLTVKREGRSLNNKPHCLIKVIQNNVIIFNRIIRDLQLNNLPLAEKIPKNRFA